MADRLEEILGKHSVHFNYSKAETRAKLRAYCLEERLDEVKMFLDGKYIKYVDLEDGDLAIRTSSIEEYREERIAKLKGKS